MAGPSFDDLIPNKTPAQSGGDGGLSFDDLIPQSGAPADDAGGVNFDDLLPAKPKSEPEMRSYESTSPVQDFIARHLMPDDPRKSPMQARIVEAVTGSRGLGPSQVGMLDVFPPTGVLFSGERAKSAAERGDWVGAGLNAIGVIPAGTVAKETVKLPARTEVERLARAAEKHDVSMPRAVTYEGTKADVADVVKEIPTGVIPAAAVSKNPIRERSKESLLEMDSALTNITRKVTGGVDDPVSTSRQAFDDWFAGRGAHFEREAAEGAAEKTAALRASMGPETASPELPLPQGVQEIITPDSTMKIRAKPELVEVSDLQLAKGKIQPRDRDRPEYAQEARERASRLDPQQLQPSRVSDAGAPIVMPNGMILSGNGRILSIGEAYSSPALRAQAEAYKASLGQEAQKMAFPVLIMRTEAMEADDAARFADLSNRSRIASMSATERAARDAQALGPDGMALYQGGDFDAPQNLQFKNHFMGQVVTASERPAMSKGGELSQEGRARLRAAVLHSAYEDPALISRMLESTDDNIRSITGAMSDAAPGFVQLRNEVKAGTVLPEMDTTASLNDAVKLIADLRARDSSVAGHFAQIDAFSNPDPLVEAWVRAFYNEDLSRPVSRQKMADVLNAYTTEARKHAPGGLFTDSTTSGDVLKVAQRSADNQGPESLGSLASSVVEGIRDSGQVVRGSAAAEVGGGVAEAGSGRIGNASNAGTGNASAVSPRHQVLTPERSKQIVTENLLRAKKERLARDVGIDVDSASPGRVVTRISEMARSKNAADVQGIIKARQTLGDELWADSVMPQVFHVLGGGRAWDNAVSAGRMTRVADDFDFATFAAQWNALSKTKRDAVFGSLKTRRGLRQSLDELALLAGTRGRLEELAAGKVEEAVRRVPLLRYLMGSRNPTERVGQAMAHAGLIAATHGAVLAVPALTYATARIMSRPLTARATTRWVHSIESIDGSKGSIARNMLAARSLATAIAEEFDGDADAIEAGLIDGPGAGRPPGMMRLGGPKDEPAGGLRPLGRFEQDDSGNFYRDAEGNQIAINPTTDVVGRDGMVYAADGEAPNPEAAKAMQGVNVFGKMLGAVGLDASGKRAKTSWGEALRNTRDSMSLVNPLHSAANATQRMATERTGLQDEANPGMGMEIAGTVGGASVPVAAAGGVPRNALGVFIGPVGAKRLAAAGHPRPMAALQLAEKLEASGVDRESIYKQTSKLLKGTEFAGASKTADGKWKVETSDDLMKIIAPGKNAGFQTGSVSHPLLQIAYPDLGKLRASITAAPHVPQSGFFRGAFLEGEDGKMTWAPEIHAEGSDPFRVRQVIAHELDHFAQGEEDFSRGGNAMAIAPRDEKFRTKSPDQSGLIEDRFVGPEDTGGPAHGKETELRRYAGQVVHLPPIEKIRAESALEKERLLGKWRKYSKGTSDEDLWAEYGPNAVYENTMPREFDASVDSYQKLGGEKSANETMGRILMTPAERRKTPPELYADENSIAAIGDPRKSGDGTLIPSRETIAQHPATVELATRIHKQLEKRMKGKTEDEIWRAAFSSAVAEIERRVEKKGGWGNFAKARRIDKKVPNQKMLWDRWKKKVNDEAEERGRKREAGIDPYE